MSNPAGASAGNSKSTGLTGLLRRLVVLQPGEAPVLLAAFAMLFCVFTSYAILRPVRDTMGITQGVQNLPAVFWGTFTVMLVVQPIYGWLTSRFRRRIFLPWVYGFFVANLLGFYLWFNLQADHTWIARVYFIWVSVFNLFILATFWSLMADVLSREQAGRMFGFIAAGTSVGGLVGPTLIKTLTKPLSTVNPLHVFGNMPGARPGEMGTINLLLISSVILLLSLVFLGLVNRWEDAQKASSAKTAGSDAALGGSMWAAFVQVVKSPYLLGIAAFVFLLTWITTPLYLEQSTFVRDAIHSRDEQTQFFANIDQWVQIASLIGQLLLFGHLFKWLGMRALLALVPVLMIIGYAVFAVMPAFMVVVWVYAIRRVGDYAFTRPCRDSLYTVVSREEKYKAKSLIDTFIYRGGDATSGSVYAALTGSLGLTASGVGWFGVVLSALWLWLAYGLGKAQQRGRTEVPAAGRPVAGRVGG